MSFINPLFLFGLIGASLPVLIHLTRDMRAKKVQFSSLMFLRNTPKELIKRRRLSDLFLLILRAVIFGLLAFAFARPFFPREKVQIRVGNTDKSVVLLIDNSYSMQYGDLFERVHEEALKILNEAGARDEFSLVFFSDEAEQVTSLTSERAVHKNGLEKKLKATYRPTEFYQPLRLAEEILKDAQNPSRQIIMISDFQNNGFTTQFEYWKLDPGITFIPVQVAARQRPNAFVNSFGLKQSRVGNTSATEYRVEIGSSDHVEDEEGTVHLWINGENVGQEKARMNQAFFQERNLKEGMYRGFIQISDDNLVADNAYYFTYSIDDLPSILCIDNNRRNNHSDAFFLRSVFHLGDESLYRFTSGGVNNITEDQLRRHDLVFLTNSGSLSDGQINTISKYISDGGRLIISFGERMNLERFSVVLRRLGVGSIVNKDMIQNPSLQNGIVGQVDFKHPIFSVFVQSGASELYRPKFRRFVQIDPDSNAVVLGSYDSGDPFLIESRYGKGRIFVFTSTFNTRWTDFPVYEIYVPFLYQLAKHAVSQGDNRTSFFVGATVLLKGNPGDEWEVTAPGNDIFRVVCDETGVGRFQQTDMPGNYSAISGRRRFSFSVNVDVRESNLLTRNTEEALAVIARPDEETRLDLAGTLSGDYKKDEKQQKLWLYVVLFVVLLLFLVLAQIFH